MPVYDYTVLTGSGETLVQSADSPSLPALASALRSQGSTMLTAAERRARGRRVKGIPYFEVLAIYRQIAASLEAGMPLAETLDMLSSESRNPGLKEMLYSLKVRVSTGSSLSTAMGEFPNVFPGVHIAAVRAGEESGRLDVCLSDLADQAETFSNMNRRLASALVYPVVIACVAILLLGYGTFGVVPRIRMLFNDLGVQDLPTVTSIVFFIADTAFPILLMIVSAAAILVATIVYQRSAASGRLWLDAWKLRIPIIGQIVEKAALARFSGTLGLLLDSGVDLPSAVRLAAEGTGNRTVEQLLKQVSAQVERGGGLGASMDLTGAIAPSLAWRIGVGEETGTLPRSLMGISKLYAGQVDSLVTSFASILEPALILCIGVGIAMLVLGMFLPLANVISCLSGGYS